MIKKQFTLYLENRQGVLAGVTAKLAAAKVNIEGISVAESTDVAIVQVVVDNAAATKRAFDKAGIPFTVQDVAMVHLSHQPGELAKILTKVARDGININYVYATGCDCKSDCNCYAIIGADNLKKVEKAWKNA